MSASSSSDRPEFHRLLTGIGYKEKVFFTYKPVDSLLQVGPTCGLVCLAQAKRFIQPNSGPFAVDTLLSEAKRMGLSNHGEMFSAAGVERLARDVLGLNASTWTCLETNRDLIIERLLNGAAILIPYDSNNGDQKPVLLGGKAAHWCICTGFAFGFKLRDSNGLAIPVDLTTNPVDLDITEIHTSALPELLNSSTSLRLFCKQGNSNFLQAFNFRDLVQSNKNLFSPKSGHGFKIPVEGIGQSLCNKFVVIT